MYDVCIIGAGASGLACAIAAARKGRKVLVLEKNKKAGKKLYATGNGKCNLTNKLIDTRVCYTSSNPEYEAFLGSFYENGDLCAAVCTFMNSVGIQTVALGDYVYPASEQASAVVWALLDEMKRLNVDLRCSCEVTSVERNENGYTVSMGDENISAAKVVLACGGMSSPALGGSESGYKLCDALKIPLTPLRPALAALQVREAENFSMLNGVRAKGIVSLFNPLGFLFRKEAGEVQFSEKGLSGIVCMNASCFDAVRVEVNLLSAFYEDFNSSFFHETGLNREGAYDGRYKDRTLIGFLNGYLPDKVSAYIVAEFGYEKSTLCSEVTGTKLFEMLSYASHMSFDITGTEGFEKAQVTAGGVPLDYVDAKTMEVVEQPGLYITGELLDVTGICGGYNLSFAFLSGLRAGANI